MRLCATPRCGREVSEAAQAIEGLDSVCDYCDNIRHVERQAAFLKHIGYLPACVAGCDCQSLAPQVQS